MTFENTYNLSDILNIISIMLVITGGAFAYYQWRRSVLLKRASYINELTDKIYSDPDIKDSVYLLQYNKNWYSKQFHGNTALELKIDKTLSYFSYICYLKKQKIISTNDFDFLKYEVESILLNDGIQDYLYNYYHYATKLKIPVSFAYLLDYGEEHNLIKPDFFDRKAYKKIHGFHKYLDF